MTFLKQIAGAAALGAALLLGSSLTTSPAQAGYVVTLEEVGSDVVAAGNGPIDLTGLTNRGFQSTSGIGMFPLRADLATGFPGNIDIYTGFTGPANFGSGGRTIADSGSGDIVGIFVDEESLVVPAGYVSGTLSDTATWNGETFSSLGVTPSTYVWSWETERTRTSRCRSVLLLSPSPPALRCSEWRSAGLLLAGMTRRTRHTA